MSDDLDLASIERLVQLMADNDLLEVEVRNGPDRRVRLSRRPPETAQQMMMIPAQGQAVSAQAPAPPAAGTAGSEADGGQGPARDANTLEFVSPMVGTFYRAPTPESPPYVMAHDKVNTETVLCIIEAMKVLNEIKAEMDGEVIDILVENGEAVEFGQPLFLIRKSG